MRAVRCCEPAARQAEPAHGGGRSLARTDPRPGPGGHAGSADAGTGASGPDDLDAFGQTIMAYEAWCISADGTTAAGASSRKNQTPGKPTFGRRSSAPTAAASNAPTTRSGNR